MISTQARDKKRLRSLRGLSTVSSVDVWQGLVDRMLDGHLCNFASYVLRVGI